ncbi:Ig-like domain-containing protein [Arthrobacter sp. NPDC057388]|uniref:Ig-like domain-containing protein n=1 Tax=Arthrobacter sp. NPDC057388 TaxID=3346116 RepID=UPI00363312C8
MNNPRRISTDYTFFRPDGRGRDRNSSWLGVALLAATLLALGALVAPVPPNAAAAPGDVGVEGPSHAGTGTPTGTKRQSNELWFNDGIWWGNLWDTATADFHIFRFNADASSWVDTGVRTETRPNTHHDVLWDGTTLFVASYRFVNDGLPAQPNSPTTMRRYSYNSSTKTYVLESSQSINNHATETLSIDKDSTGRVWATWPQDNRIYVNVTATDGTTWGTPFPLPAALANVSVDDDSALIAFGPGKIGVMWSRQVGDATDGMYWSVHNDGAADSAWSTPVAAVSGQRSGDDHMNLKWLDSTNSGRVFAATKTSFTSASQPLIQLLTFDGSAWSAHTIATVSECPNRVIVMIDESTQRLRTFATYPKPSGTTNAGVCSTSGGAIYEKSTPLNDISFTTSKTARIVDADQYVHNVTSTKQNLNSAAQGTASSGVLVLADVNATSRYWHFYEPGSGAGDDTTPPTVAGTAPAAGATGTAATANVTATFSEAMNASTVTPATFTLTAGTTAVPATVAYNSTSRVATLNPTASLAAGTTYTATIKGGANGVKDAAGNALVTNKTWTFTASRPPTTNPSTSRPSIRSAADVVAAGSDGVLWNYAANARGGFQPRQKIGVGWLGLNKGFVTDWNSDGVFDLIAQWNDGRLSFYPGRPGGGFLPARAIGHGWGSYHVTVGRWRTTGRYPGILAYDSAGTLWYYGNSAGSLLSSRIRSGTGWGGLYLTMTDFDQDGRQDVLAKRTDGKLVLYRSTGTGRFAAEARRTVGTGWNGINGITAVSGFAAGSSGLMARLNDGRLAHYPFSRGTWGARTIVGSGWNPYNIFR